MVYIIQLYIDLHYSVYPSSFCFQPLSSVQKPWISITSNSLPSNSLQSLVTSFAAAFPASFSAWFFSPLLCFVRLFAVSGRRIVKKNGMRKRHVYFFGAGCTKRLCLTLQVKMTNHERWKTQWGLDRVMFNHNCWIYRCVVCWL